MAVVSPQVGKAVQCVQALSRMYGSPMSSMQNGFMAVQQGGIGITPDTSGSET